MSDWITTGDVPVGDFAADTDVQPDPDVPGRFSLEVSPAWNVFYTFGGMTHAIALRAAQRVLARDDLQPLTAHAVFCAPVAAGPVAIDAAVVRNGRSASQVRADLRQGGATALALLATFGQESSSWESFEGIGFPDDVVPDPEACPTRDDMAAARAEVGEDVMPPFPPLNFHQQNDWRPAMRDFDPARSWDEPGPARFSTWMRLVKEPRLADGTIDPVSYCIAADSLGPAVGRRLGAGMGRNFLILSLEIDLQIFGPTESPWILQHMVAQHGGGGYAFGTTELWSEERRLIGFATQRAKLRAFNPGEPIGPT